MIAMILAAGRGERLRPVTDTIPKALVEVGGRSLIERHLDALSNAGIETVVINLGWHGEQIHARIGSGSAYGLSVIYSPEGDDILETGGGIHRALPLLGDAPFLVVNADIYTDMRFPSELPENALGHLVLVPTPDHKRSGDFDLDGDRVVNGDRPALTFSGVALYRPALFDGQSAGRFPLAPL
ncbi:MAG: nucleotidyltransferase family protein, partial [Woeseiaceae bacterium]|nr:nucleotidyltransferase family protein [Woeseiaceae bacterium]